MQTNNEKTIFYFEQDPGYEKIQEITKGNFTTMKLTDNRILFLNETGEYHLPINKEATVMFGIIMYGNIVIVGKKQST